LPPFDLGIWYLNIAVTIALLFRLIWSRLFRVYRWLFLYIAADALQQCVGLLFPRNTNRYAEAYMVGQALKIVLVVFVVLELYRLALSGQPALAKYGQETAGITLVAAACVAALGLLLDPTAPPGRSIILYRFFSFERTMDTWVLIFLVVICLFMTWFPVRMKRNVVFYLGGFMLHFLARSAGLLLLNVLSAARHDALNNAMLSISFACLVMWLCAFGEAGEKATTVVGQSWDPGAMEKVRGQLDSINASLTKLSRSARGA
jgi:hypothetical protein